MPVVHDETDEPDVGNVTVHAPSPYPPWVSGAGEFARGTWTGLKKGAASMVPANVEGQELKDWSSSPGEGGMETAGEWTGDIGANLAPFLIPFGGIASKITRLPGIADAVGTGLGNLALRWRTGRQAQSLTDMLSRGVPRAIAEPRALKTGNVGYKAIKGTGQVVGKGAEAVGKGAVAGGTEAAIRNEDVKDPSDFWTEVFRGGVTGGATAGEFAAGRMAYEALPLALKHMLSQGAEAATTAGVGLSVFDRAGHHHWIPWHMLTAATKAIYETGRAALKLPSSVVGAGSEAAREGGFPSLRKGQGDEDAVIEPKQGKEPEVHSGVLSQPEDASPDQTDDQSQ